MRIEDAIKLQVARQKQKNANAGRPLHKRCLNKSNLGRILYPGSKAPGVQISALLKSGNIPSTEMLDKVCDATGVDPNFIYGFPSSHDKDFRKLVQNVE